MILLWERYGLPPKRRETIERIARALGVDPEDLLTEPSEEGGESQ